ncbi:VOC family protein [Halomarina rubra]|uniref:VOC family protein n=1 Tax=Halomarina rubra TaxID=2071873 RepID=A0ABD6AQT1_9EURY|nr:VOC family protein [Halomarina rubra]
MAPVLHLCLNVADVDASESFYEQFGFERSRSLDLGGVENRFVADDNGIELQLREHPEIETLDTGNAWDHLSLGVDSVDDELDRIEHGGLVNGPMDVDVAGARVAFVEDPDGHVVELLEELAG